MENGKKEAVSTKILAQFSDRIISTINEHCPNLKDKISYSELSSPLSTRGYGSL